MSRHHKETINLEFKSVIELIKAFPTQQVCIDHLEQLRWNGNVVSPFDATSKVYKCAGNKYKCKNTGKYFNVCIATLFDNTKIELQTWFLAIYLIKAHKKGISSLLLAKDLNVTQKTAWFMNHRIRACFGMDHETNDGCEKMGGEGVIVEVDETIIGGKVKNMSNKKRAAIIADRSARTNDKTTVIGYIEHGNKVQIQAVKSGEIVTELVMAKVDTSSVLMTDSANTYAKIGQQFAHHGIVDHSKKEYARQGIYYTNSIEGCFSLLDRMIIVIYHSVSPKHLQAYLNEHSFRYNSKDTLEFLGIWESINNQNFKPLEFEGLLKDAGTNRFSLSVKKWADTTNAIGVASRPGKGGGTFAHKDIAFEFGSWLSPTFKLYLIKEFQRLKDVESNQQNLEWDARRMLSKANYHLHTEAIKECIIPVMHVDKDKEWIVYANEADIINVALFGCTAKQWKEANPTLALQGYNIREVASINQLVVLSNMENNNSVFIRNGFDRKARFIELKRMAQEQIAQFNRIYPEKSFRKAVEGSYTPSPQKQLSQKSSDSHTGGEVKTASNEGNPLSDHNQKLLTALNYNPKEDKK